MGLIALLTQAIPLITSLFGSVERFVAERAATQSETEGETLRKTLGMSAETAEMFNATLAKAKAQMGVAKAAKVKKSAKALPAASINDVHDQVDELLVLLPQIKAQLPPRS